jgi:hypothetical protein
MGCCGSKKQARTAAEPPKPKAEQDEVMAEDATKQGEEDSTPQKSYDEMLREALAFVMDSGTDLSVEINQAIADEKLLSKAQKDAVIAEHQASMS